MKKILTILAILMVVVAAKADNVSTAEAFKAAIENNSNVNLMTDIDLSGLSASEDAAGYLFTTYTATLNGNGHSLKNSTYALFYRASGATVKNIVLDGFTLTNVTSAIARISANCTFKDITVKNSSLTANKAGDNTGMIAGYSENDSFEYCTVSPGCSVTSRKNEVGGIAGYAIGDNVIFSHCYNGADVKSIGTTTDGSDCAGGIVGESTIRKFEYCLNTGNISADDYVGGICGYNEREASGDDFLEFWYCVNTGTIDCDDSWYSYEPEIPFSNHIAYQVSVS